ncbi:MAG: hypothetical protein ACTHLW_11920 [Verrucomicrobiota bacterium]
MKRKFLILFSAIAMFAATADLNMSAADPAPQIVSPAPYEYLTIRWSGRDNTHVIRPNGEVEFVGGQLKNFKRPDRADDRSFYMNVVMNGLAREGWELAAMTSDDYVMKRAVKH